MESDSALRVVWSRREFLTLLGATGLFSAVRFPLSALGQGVTTLGRVAGGKRYRVIRARDLLSFELELLNLEVVKTLSGPRPKLEIHSNGANGFVVLHFTGQHIAEQAIWDRGGQEVADPDHPDDPTKAKPTAQKEKQDKADNDAPAPLTYRLWDKLAPDKSDTDLAFLQRAGDSGLPRNQDPDTLHGLTGGWLSGPTQLVFELPQELTPLAFDLDEIVRLCAEELMLVVAPGVVAANKEDNDRARVLSRLDGRPEPILGHYAGGLHIPGAAPYTVIEFPSLLSLSPYRSARWRVRPTPADGRAELWALELERPQDGTLPGTPRSVQPRGHLFAFAWRTAGEARWPQPQKAVRPDDAYKYSKSECPKTALYEATRKLLVKQLYDDNGDVIADRFRLSALGATARLQYHPALDTQVDENLEGSRPRDNRATSQQTGETNDGEGILSEWLQKTEAGRDFYSKESFTGYWMPFGFKAEVVTITERLLCSLNSKPIGKPITPAAGLSDGAAPSADEFVVDLRDDEAQLTAQLVARKFGRIRGSRTRVFSDTESADFAQLVDEKGNLQTEGKAGRSIGLQKVEVLVERTPVLANQQIDSADEKSELAHIAAGEDARVDGGAGIDAAREIFWPRVQAFIMDEQGRQVRRLVVYKFPVRYTFLDGSTRTTEIPMLFVPTLSKGLALYPNAKSELRTTAIDAKMPMVTPPPRAVVYAGDLGGFGQIGRAAAHLKRFLPSGFASLLPPQPDGSTASNELSAGSSVAIAEGLNVCLGQLPAEVARRVTLVAPNLKSLLEKAPDPELAFRDTLCQLLLYGGLPATEAHLDAVIADVNRAIAWGTQVTDIIDAAGGADRLTRMFVPADLTRFPVAAKSAIKKLGDFLDHDPKAPSLPTAAKKDFQNDIESLQATAPASTNDLSNDKVMAAFQKALSQFLVHWVAWLSSTWQRSAWDDVFKDLVTIFDPAATTAAQVSALQKELQRALLRGADAININDGQSSVTIHTPELSAVSAKLVEEDLAAALDRVMNRLNNAALQQVAGLQRVLDGLSAAMPEERALLARLRQVVQDYSELKPDQLQLQVGRVLVDARTHLLFVLTHFENGRTRWEQFLQTALGAPETIRALGDPVRKEWEAVQTRVRGAIQKTVTAVQAPVGKIQQDLGDTVKRLMMTANPEQIRQRLNDFGKLTGGRLTEDLQEGFKRVSSRGNLLLSRLKTFAGDAESAPTQVRTTLQELFGLAQDLVQSYRSMLMSLLRFKSTDGKTDVLSAMQKLLPTLASRIDSADKLALRFQAFATQTEAQVEYVSWRLGLAARDLVSDVQRAIAAQQQSFQAVRQQGIQDLKTVGAQLETDLRQDLAVSQQTISRVLIVLAATKTSLESGLQQRIDDLQNVIEQWIKAIDQRGEDLLEHLVATLWGVLQNSEDNFQRVITTWLQGLSEDLIRDALENAFPAAAQAAADLRRFTGEVEEVKHRFDRLSDEMQADARQFYNRLNDQAQELGNKLATALQARLGHVEGDLLSMTRRAALSLPSPALLNEFQDQTRKAIFQTAATVFTVTNIGRGITCFLAHPSLDSMNIAIPGVDGNKVINYSSDYLTKGLRDSERAVNEVFAQIQGEARTAVQNSGIADVATQVGALSREAGNLAQGALDQFNEINGTVQQALQNLRQGAQDSLAKLQTAGKNLEAEAVSLLPIDPKLFNALPLTDLIKTIASPGDLPKTIESHLPDRIERSFSFSQEAKGVHLSILNFDPVGTCRFQVQSRVTVWVPGPGRDPRPPSYSLRGGLDAFGIDIAQSLRVNFASLSFTCENGEFKCAPRLGKVAANGTVDQEQVVEFLGSLAFVNDLRKQLGALLAKNGLKLAVEGDTIYAGLTIRVPDITLGAVAITNLAMSMSLGLPLGSGPMRLRFALSDPIDTFRVQVTIFAGGGFFALDLCSNPEFSKVQTAIEFGGSLSLNVGFASGNVSVMAGIYYEWSGHETVLSAYLRACGNIMVLGFIEVSIVIYLALDYRSEGQQNQLHGSATITISVKIGFFSKSFSLTYEKTIAGSSSSSPSGPAGAGTFEGPLFASLSSNWGEGLIGGGLPEASPRPITRLASPNYRDPGGALTKGAQANSDPPLAPRLCEALQEADFIKYWRAFDDTLTSVPNGEGGHRFARKAPRVRHDSDYSSGS